MMRIFSFRPVAISSNEEGDGMVGENGVCNDHSGRFHVMKSTTQIHADYLNEMAREYATSVLEKVYADQTHKDTRVMF
jgi:hypothetical protein